ncbi:cardiolipin synthase [Carnobacteriaceae bacterium zg-ZUI78]|uniref:cardiolipin synthase n=1 Tax=Granulicatella sp. zg-84 TaxID=2678503 RepID=UPI0013BF4748|nr:cardiolipin synthase [Granulicatella sp. zg-84]MBS4749892.1 cardiolipin synthase [Carnobacteriaceae bacterium zg-ZUI78]NEW66385.1 cardiolipin synthase [Granulicatella sp. zg-84]QMI86149.1 cardiolipin synthase [Carnobacteriaceae bacterium zg-84]
MFTIILIIIFLNTLAALITVFRESRGISSTWTWLLVLVLLPIIGFILYLFIGKKISKENIFDLQKQERLGLRVSASEQKELLEKRQLAQRHSRAEKEMISLFLNTEEALYTKGNVVDIIDNGNVKFEQLLEDINNATHHIHLQYYIFNNDDLGKKIMRALYKKASQGVEVLVLYDALGSRTLNPQFFRRLTKAGGKALSFFGSSIPIVNLRFNYRNHRKIVVIDGKIGYVGGFNIGDEYLGKGKLGYWRDTHLRISGEAVHSLQTRFFVDWNAVAKLEDEKGYKEEYFPPFEEIGHTAMQIVCSGPESDWDQIKLGYVKMISLAKKSIWIQTPYFIPDESVMDALRIAIMSGIEVNIMIPCKPDHPLVYRATEYYAKICGSLGANIYVYQKGFMHSKVLSIDGRMASVGTANFDIRSFELNFEVCAFMYDAYIAKTLEEQFKRDIEFCEQATPEYFSQQSLWRKLKQLFSRLFSPVL